MKFRCRLAVFVFTFLLPFLSEAQSFRITGIVIDQHTAKPLAFVNIIADTQTNATTTDIDGKFSLVSNSPLQTLSFSYVGYEPLTITLSGESSLEIKLFRKAFQLQEAVVFPGENPAHRIIRNVTANRNKNNPEQLKSFSYVSYNKMYFTLDTGNTRDYKNNLIKPQASDTLDEKEMLKFIEEQYIMLMEFVSKREYKYKGATTKK